MTNQISDSLEEEGRAGVDPITFSVFMRRCDSIVKEMGIVLERSAWSSMIALSRDYSCVLYDDAYRQITMADALPVHCASMHLVVEEIARAYEGRVADGDVFVCNDPRSGNTHI